jgi:hypothetical protein
LQRGLQNLQLINYDASWLFMLEGTMRELTVNECFTVNGGEDNTFDLNDVFDMIENREDKLLLLGTLLAFGTSYYCATVGGKYSATYALFGGIGGLIAGAYLLPLAFITTYAMVDQSYHFFGFVK